MRTRIPLLLLASVALAAPCLHADEVVDKPLGEPVERHLSDYQPFRQWVHDPALFEKEAGDRLETRQVAGEELETVKLTGLVAPIRFESGVADIPAGYVEKLENILDGMRGRRNVRLHFVGHADSEGLSESLARPGPDPRLVCVPGDLSAPGLIGEVLDRHTVSVFHLAAVVSAGAEADFDLGYRVNLDGTRFLLAA